jgi:hypothetical protein
LKDFHKEFTSFLNKGIVSQVYFPSPNAQNPACFQFIYGILKRHLTKGAEQYKVLLYDVFCVIPEMIAVYLKSTYMAENQSQKCQGMIFATPNSRM